MIPFAPIWRIRISDWWYDARHPITTFQREVALRYCRKQGRIMVPNAPTFTIMDAEWNTIGRSSMAIDLDERRTRADD